MYPTLGARRRLRTLRFWLTLGCVLVPVGAFCCYIFFFFGLRYDFPFRLEGHFEKNVEFGDHPFTVSPKSKTIVYSTTASGHGNLWTMDLDGQNSQQLTSNSEYESAPCYSPDGHHIVFSRETGKCGHLWLMNTDGTGATQLTFGPDYDANPVFTPDGQSIWFEGTPYGNSIGHYAVFIMTSTGKNIRPWNGASSGRRSDVCFAPDNSWVYLTRTDYSSSNPYQVWRVKPDGTGQQSLADGSSPAVSPASKEVAFVAGNVQHELWIMEADGSHKRLVYHSNSGKSHIAFAADGRRLFFLDATTKGIFISSVKLDGSAYHQLVDVTPEKE